METLTRTPFFQLLCQQSALSNEESLNSTFKDFMCQLAQACVNVRGGTPPYFTLMFTRVELMGLQEKYQGNGTEKKYAVRYVPVQSPAGC